MNSAEDFDEFIIHGPESLYEPSEGGLGYELFRCMNLYKGRTAQYITDTNEKDTYESLKARSVRVAINLLKQGITKNDVVCLCSHEHLNSYVTNVASLLIGAKFAALDSSQSERELGYLLDYIQPKIIFISEKMENTIEKLLENASWEYQIVVFGISQKYTSFMDYLELVEGEKEFQPSTLKNNKETAIIFFSSGTTGKPKGICSSHYGFLGQVLNTYHCLKFGNSINLSNYSHKFSDETEFKIMTSSPLYWISGSLIAAISILTGSTRVMSYKFDVKNVWKTIEHQKVNLMCLQPSQGNEIFAIGRPSKVDTSSLKYVFIGGAAITEKHLQKMQKLFPEALCGQFYGMTEVTGPLTLFNFAESEDLEFLKKKMSSSGRPVACISYKVVDTSTEKAVGVHENGELRVKSSYLMNGFYKSDSSSAFDSEGWFKTGDLVYYDTDSCFYVIDRIKDIVKYSIYTIQPSIIEAVLTQHPAVLECFVFGYPHEEDNEHLMAVVVLQKNVEHAIAEDLCAFVDDRLSDRYKLRGGIKFVEEMLRTSTGKIKKLAIKSLILEGKL